MQEFIEKLIGRLEEEREISYADFDEYLMKYELDNDFDEDDDWFYKGLIRAIEIVNQLAEEYKDKAIINEQYCFQTCGATEHCKECNRLCNGSIDYYENYDFMAEEHNNDFCEWRKQGGYNFYLHKTSCGTEDTFDDSYKYCPYCGKQIKITPY